MKALILLTGLIVFQGFCSDKEKPSKHMEDAKKAGEKYGKEQTKTALKEIKKFSEEDLLPEGKKLNDIDTELLRQQILEGQSFDSEIRDFLLDAEMNKNIKENKNLHEEEFLFKKSDKSVLLSTEEDKEIRKEPSYEEIKCFESGEPGILKYVRDLKVEVIHTPKKEKKIKHCLGHEIVRKGKNLNELRKNVPIGRSIVAPTEHIGKEKKTWIYKYIYRHVDDCETCDKFKIETKLIEKERWEEGKEYWIANRPDLQKLSEESCCTFISSKCLDNTPEKIINGKTVKRKCWKEELIFRYFHPVVKGCDFLKENQHHLVSRKCLKDTEFGCALWELTFKRLKDAGNEKVSQLPSRTIWGMKEELGERNFELNKSFTEVATKLAVFEEIKKDLERSEAEDANRASIFKGECFKCSTNVLENVVYDCCFKMKGLATKLLLTKCSEEEISLADRRERGLCHYIGSYQEKFLDVLWKSRDVHVFSCFPSKLARVLQEQARLQLNKGWGTPENPDCSGLKVQELKKLDFSKIDLSEVYEDLVKKIPINLEEKLKSFQKRLETKVIKDGEKLGKTDSSVNSY